MVTTTVMIPTAVPVHGQTSEMLSTMPDIPTLWYVVAVANSFESIILLLSSWQKIEFGGSATNWQCFYYDMIHRQVWTKLNGYIMSNYLSDASKLEENVIVDGYAAWYTISIHVALA